MRFSVDDGDGTARTGVLETARGLIHSPAFMPVGTQGTVKAMSPDEMKEMGAEILLCNTYHLYLVPDTRSSGASADSTPSSTGAVLS